MPLLYRARRWNSPSGSGTKSSVCLVGRASKGRLNGLTRSGAAPRLGKQTHTRTHAQADNDFPPRAAQPTNQPLDIQLRLHTLGEAPAPPPPPPLTLLCPLRGLLFLITQVQPTSILTFDSTSLHLHHHHHQPHPRLALDPFLPLRRRHEPTLRPLANPGTLRAFPYLLRKAHLVTNLIDASDQEQACLSETCDSTLQLLSRRALLELPASPRHDHHDL